MKEFEKLETGSVSEVEKSIRNSWGGIHNILNETIENRKDCEEYVFYDGPIYANAKPGLHHVFAKTIKDAFANIRQ